MIQEISVKNFLSFKDKVTFSFEATKDKTFEDHQVVEVAKGVRLLRFALVYGPNASGKSNLLRIFDFLEYFWFEKRDNIDEATGTIPFRLDVNTPSMPSEFELKFYIGNTRYWYILSLYQDRVQEEKLYYYKSVQPTMLFSRKWEDNQSVLVFNPSAVKISRTAQDEISLKCLSNMSVFAARNQVNVSVPEIDAAKNWMRTKVMTSIHPMTSMFEYANRKMIEDASLKSYLLDFIRKADFNITGVKSDVVKNPIGQSELNYRTTFEHTVKNERGTEVYTLPHTLQSDGTTRTLGVETAIYESIKKESFLCIDEIESSLHPELVEFIIQKFLSSSNRSQLLVTTHYDPLLNTVGDLMRSDSVWFTEKDESGATKMYSLSDFKGLKRMSSYQKAYRNGLFGALPNIKG